MFTVEFVAEWNQHYDKPESGKGKSMKHLPILQELFESDTIIFLIIGIAVAVVAGLWLKNQKKCIIGIIISVVLYLICELASNFRTNFMLELILLFIGTVAIGCCIGFIIYLLVRLLIIKKKVTP